MAKKSVKIAATYFITIIAALVLIGGVGFYFLNSYLNADNSKTMKVNGTTAAQTDSEEFVPTDIDARTVLAVYDGSTPGHTDSASRICFVLFRLAPAQNKLVIVPLQTDIQAVVNGQADTLYNFYRTGGTASAVRAVESATLMPVEKYIKVNDDSLKAFSDMCGNVSFEIPYNLINESDDPEENVVLRKGNQILEFATMKKILTFPVYNGGEEYRAKVVGEITQKMLDNGCAGAFRSDLSSVYNTLVNSGTDTNVTAYDFNDDKPSIEYILANTTSPTQLVIPSGVYEGERYILDQSFIDALPRWFFME
ncbi:MAG: hypothetical protein II714_01655 [Oscillospiraceae bacterium]|nr:hypothetical protein [Oscillospiraceae bacterium]